MRTERHATDFALTILHKYWLEVPYSIDCTGQVKINSVEWKYKINVQFTGILIIVLYHYFAVQEETLNPEAV